MLADTATPGIEQRARQDVQALMLTRAALLVAQTVLLGVARLSPGQEMPLLVLAACIAPAAAVSLLALMNVRSHRTLDDTQFYRQILIDIAMLTYMLAMSGGPGNPFHDTYFLPVAVAAASLPMGLVWRVVAVALAGYTVTDFIYVPLPGNPEEVARIVRPGEWLTHLMMASLAAYFVARLTRGLRERDERLALAQETTTRADTALAIGSVAAGAAHELGTPLTTMTMVLGELRDQYAHDPELRRNLELLEGSLAECRKTLQVLRLSTQAALPASEPMPVDRLLGHVVRRFTAMCPHAVVRVDIDADAAAPTVQPNLALQQAVINLLSNAAFVSPRAVRLGVEWGAGELSIRVCDRGPGIAADIAERLGRDCISTKPSDRGRGVGLLLTKVTAERFGGRFRIFNADGGGAVAEIVVPLISLQTPEG